MKTRRADQHLAERLEVLSRIAEVSEGRVPQDVRERAADTVERARGRLGHGAGHTVVALAGATGSGKSSTFNALADRELAKTGVRRPTTSSTQAAVFATTATLRPDTAGLLEWLGVHNHTVVEDPELDGLVLLDLPDHDSTHASHRQEVDRLTQVVDVFVWVVDPQKYADAVLHRDYLRRFAGHADVTVVVLNQIDLLPAEARRAALDDLTRIVAEDGLAVARPGVVAKVTGRDEGVRVMSASARTGEGIDALRRDIAARVSARRALIDRLAADVDWIADDLAGVIGEREPRPLSRGATGRLGAGLARAAGVDVVVDAVESAHRRRGSTAAGWPPTRWISSLRPDPLRRLGLDRLGVDRASASQAERSGAARPADDAHVDRTSLPPASSVSTAAASLAVRAVVDEASTGLPDEWRHRLAHVASARRADLDDALDRAVGRARLPVDRPAWWRVASLIQWVLAAAMVVGLVWLTLIFVVAWWNLPDLPTPELGELPVPTVLAIGGAALGWLLAGFARWATRIGARRRGAIARERLTAAVTDVGRELIVEPLDAELTALSELHGLTRRLRDP